MTNDNPPQAPSTAQPPPEEQVLKLSFDKAALGKFRDAALLALHAHPEVRSVAVILDYRGGLNTAPSVDKGLWIGDEGPVRRIDAVFGSIDNTISILEVMLGRAAATVQGLRDEAQVLGGEIVKRRQELEQLNAAVAAAKEEAAGRRLPDRPGDWPDRVWQGGGYVYTDSKEPCSLLASNGDFVTDEALTRFGYERITGEAGWWQLSTTTG